ncbi:hypothetical protein ACFQRB_14760 [Halobaculum litoreum]|uniref:Tat (Twin-arginine translocation) pathway signal sequence n=1 Tax=Halobaculum litoreum TaxID=3031998 RepID=A0ABD5XV32_9EURY
MNRRGFLAGLGAAAAGAVGYGGLRVADLRPYDPDAPADRLAADATPRERVLAAIRHLFAADHRAVTRVRVLDDWTGDAPYRLTRHRELHEHSRRRHTHALTTFGNGMVLADREPDGVDPRTACPYATIDAVLHFSDAVLADPETLPERFVFHVDDGTLAVDRDAPAQAVGEPVTVDGGYAGRTPVRDYPRVMFGEPIRPHRATWREHDRTGRTVTYELSGPDAYARAVPLYSPGGIDLREGRASARRSTGRRGGSAGSSTGGCWTRTSASRSGTCARSSYGWRRRSTGTARRRRRARGVVRRRRRPRPTRRPPERPLDVLTRSDKVK